MPRLGSEFGGFLQTLVLLFALATIAARLLVRRRELGESILNWAQIAGLMDRLWPPFVLLLLMVFLARQRNAFLSTVFANVAMVGCAYWLMDAGRREDRRQLFAAGVLYFLFWAVLRYFDWFGSFGGLWQAALMFFLCGAALLGVALYWRQQKGVRPA